MRENTEEWGREQAWQLLEMAVQEFAWNGPHINHAWFETSQDEWPQKARKYPGIWQEEEEE